MELTLLELSLDDAEITANAPFSDRRGPASEPADADEATEHVEGGRAAEDGGDGSFGLLAGAVLLGVALAVAVALKRRRSKEGSVDRV
jgi:hypothetical protein